MIIYCELYMVILHCVFTFKIKTEDAILLGVVLIWEVGEEKDRKEVGI